MSIAIFAAVALLLMFVFRLEGGGFYQFGNDTTPRIIRSVVFGLVFAFLTHLPINGFAAAYLISIMGASFLASNVGHGVFQGMGSQPAPETCWFTPWLRATNWSGWKMWKKILYDFSGMAMVGLICGTLSYIPYGFFTHDYAHLGCAILAIAILQPTAYVIGRALYSLFPFLKVYSTEYGEALTGLAWAISLQALSS